MAISGLSSKMCSTRSALPEGLALPCSQAWIVWGAVLVSLARSRYLITMVYLIAGKLDFRLPAVGYATHTK